MKTAVFFLLISIFITAGCSEKKFTLKDYSGKNQAVSVKELNERRNNWNETEKFFSNTPAENLKIVYFQFDKFGYIVRYEGYGIEACRKFQKSAEENEKRTSAHGKRP